ncbi:MAG: diguanylate cyclase [Anaerolineaceae bacterium]|nr:diguanylate cyclase [Anaerolineaceae bacterium]
MINQRLIIENRESLRNQELIFDTSPDAILITRLSDGMLVGLNDSFSKMTGYTKEEVINKTSVEVNIWYNKTNRQQFVDLLLEFGSIENHEYTFLRKDKSKLFGLISARLIQLQGVPHIISITHDITSRKLAEERFRMLFELSPMGLSLVDYDTGMLLEVNNTLLKLTGYTREELLQQSHWDITPKEYYKLEQTIKNDIQKNGNFGPFEKEYTHKDGSRIPISISGVLYTDISGKRINWGFIEDITERKKLQSELKKQATTDELTGLMNRRRFIEIARKEMKRSTRHEHPLTIALIDLDELKSINDVYGHAVGDQAITLFTKQCMMNLREIDIFARYGGDEFALLLPETDIDQAYVVIERMRQIICESKLIADDTELSISMSAGIATMHNQNISLDELLNRADEALYIAKANGKNRIMVDESYLDQ